MKRILTFLLAALIAVSLWGCGKKAATPENTQPTEAQIQDTSLSFGVQYIRTSGNTWDQSYPGVHVVDSREALNAYYDANKSIYDLERSEKTYSDTTIGFLNACDKYDDAFFAQSYLIFLVLHEGSLSTEHYVHKILQNSQVIYAYDPVNEYRQMDRDKKLFRIQQRAVHIEYNTLDRSVHTRNLRAYAKASFCFHYTTPLPAFQPLHGVDFSPSTCYTCYTYSAQAHRPVPGFADDHF